MVPPLCHVVGLYSQPEFPFLFLSLYLTFKRYLKAVVFYTVGIYILFTVLFHNLSSQSIDFVMLKKFCNLKGCTGYPAWPDIRSDNPAFFKIQYPAGYWILPKAGYLAITVY
jgi:hypothetical protein